jgi:hypothetical protein
MAERLTLVSTVGGNGRGTYNITALQPNVAIDAGRFGRPTPPSQARN